MAIFDSLTFNPQGFGGQGGGLLDLLRSLQTQQQVQPSGGFDGQLPPNAQPTQGQMNLTPDRMVPVGDYQMPQFGNPAPQASNAQMQPQQMPQPAPAQPGFFDQLNNGLQSIGNGGSVIGALTGNYTDPANKYGNVTQQALIQRGLDPALAQQVARNPQLLRAVLPQLMGTTGQTDDIKEYQFARKEDPTLTFQKFMQQKKSVTGEFGLTPIWGTGPDGKPAYIQPGKSGDARLAKLPEGFQIARDPVKIEGPTGTTILDPQTRQPVQFIPKDVAGAASQKAQGTAQGEAKVGLPKVIDQANEALKIVDKALIHPGLDRSTGLMGTIWSAPGTPARDFDTIVSQIKGKSFLEAFQSLKGGGAISEVEGKKATDAIARLDQAQSKEAFVEALNELKGIINIGVQRAQRLAGAPASAAAPAAPQSGVVDYRTYFGSQ